MRITSTDVGRSETELDLDLAVRQTRIVALRKRATPS